MRAFSGAHPRSAPRDAVRNPVTCIAVTLAVFAVFWAGLIWAAERLYG